MRPFVAGLRRDDDDLRAGVEKLHDRRGAVRLRAEKRVGVRREPPALKINRVADGIGVLTERAAKAFEDQFVKIVRVKIRRDRLLRNGRAGGGIGFRQRIGGEAKNSDSRAAAGEEEKFLPPICPKPFSNEWMRALTR